MSREGCDALMGMGEEGRWGGASALAWWLADAACQSGDLAMGGGGEDGVWWMLSPDG